MGTEKKNKEEIDISELIVLEKELHELKQEQGIEEKEGRVSRIISGFFERKENRQKVSLNKKKYLLMAIFTGWFGGHRFYAKQYLTGILYLAFFWTGFGLAMTIIDLLAIIPMEADEAGNVLV